uniref:Uncharacterized protein n=1 Tax=Rhizophora mucronata TaxID=61149 RepID=A0A2P2PJK7_RHIMU
MAFALDAKIIEC